MTTVQKQRHGGAQTDARARFVERGEPGQGPADNVERHRRRSGARGAPSRRDMVASVCRHEPTIRAEDDCRQRDQRRNEEDETPFVADVVQREARARRDRPRGRAAAPAAAARASARAPRATPTTPTTTVNHMRVKMSWTMGNHVTRLSSERDVVAGFPGHRHLPVVEAVVGPVGDDEDRERDERRRRRGPASVADGCSAAGLRLWPA